jgi:hypothetical protein
MINAMQQRIFQPLNELFVWTRKLFFGISNLLKNIPDACKCVVLFQELWFPACKYGRKRFSISVLNEHLKFFLIHLISWPIADQVTEQPELDQMGTVGPGTEYWTARHRLIQFLVLHHLQSVFKVVFQNQSNEIADWSKGGNCTDHLKLHPIACQVHNLRRRDEGQIPGTSPARSSEFSACEQFSTHRAAVQKHNQNTKEMVQFHGNMCQNQRWNIM